jgi:uncharacterized membrane protein
MGIRSDARRALHPALVRHSEQRAASMQNRVADAITAFAGSMAFVYLHIAWFIVWILRQPFGDKFPFGLLTMIVSLEAIFLSTFVMISQNRADGRRQALADEEWHMVQTEESQNEELLRVSQQVLELTRQVHLLTTAVHACLLPPAPSADAPSNSSPPG